MSSVKQPIHVEIIARCVIAQEKFAESDPSFPFLCLSRLQLDFLDGTIEHRHDKDAYQYDQHATE